VEVQSVRGQFPRALNLKNGGAVVYDGAQNSKMGKSSGSKLKNKVTSFWAPARKLRKKWRPKGYGL